MPGDLLFWHLYTFPDRAAAQAIKAPNLTIIEAFGKVWLYAIAEKGWRPTAGDRAAVLGPLQTHKGKSYTAHFVEAVFPPGMSTAVHFHHGSEVSYVISGSECVETPNGKIVNRAGEGAVVAENTPMLLTNPGKETRRAVALILHDASHHWSTVTKDWTPKGLCSQ